MKEGYEKFVTTISLYFENGKDTAIVTMENE